MQRLNRADVNTKWRSSLALVIGGGLAGAIPQDLPIQVHISGDELVPLAVTDLTAIIVQLAQNAVAHGADQIDLDWNTDRLMISDNGAGIASGNQERIFAPFFTSRRDQGGTGMGLAIVRSLLNAHGGRIDLVDSAKGASFEIKFVRISSN